MLQNEGNEMCALEEPQTKKLSIIIVLSALGGVSSLAIGYAGKLISFAPLGPISGQILAGLHVFWLILVAALVRSRGAATTAGALKGLVEMLLPNHLGSFVFLISLIEGFVVDLAFLPFKRVTLPVTLLASGLSSASNIAILQVFQILPSSFPLVIYVAMYFASFVSGVILGGYLSVKALSAVRQIVS
jgi:ABC-type thiamin/hydroxymethylpyrimidine transport system permease subunit